MSQIFNIQDDKVVINKLALTQLEGAVSHDGSLDVSGNVSIGHNLRVEGTITADTFNVKNLITENGSLGSVGDWAFPTEEDLNGKGFSWTYGNGNVRLQYRTGKRLWTNGDLDLEAGKTFKIDNSAVLSSTALGPSVTKSNLKEIGTLQHLSVLGEVSLGEFAFFRPIFGRLGLNTNEPNAALSVLDNDVEIIMGSPRTGVANIGTYTNHDVAIVSDNTARIVVKKNGEVIIGDEVGKNGILRVFGTFYADNIVADTRIERTSSLEFKTSRDSSIYNKGLVWSGAGDERRLVMLAGPDRLFSSESFDIAGERCYYIGGQAVLTNDSLGAGVFKSNLTQLGTLGALTVNGATTLLGSLDANECEISAKSIVLNNGTTGLNISNTGLTTSKHISVNVVESEVFYADADEITLGNRQETRRPVKVFGPLSVGISNPDPTVSLSVSGAVSFADKKFINGTEAPTSGSFVKGDICWNQDPKAGSYVGWVCVTEGTPGQWSPFGAIGLT